MNQYNPSMFIHAGSPAGQGGSEVLQSSISPFRMGPVCKNLKLFMGIIS